MFPTDADELRVLLVLADSGRPMFVDELARLFGSRDVDVAALLERLVRAGLVETHERAAGVVAAATATGRNVRKHT